MEKTDKQNKTDKSWLWKKGESGNPNGRPKGVSVTEAIREELKKYPEGSKKTYLELVVGKILIKALNDGDNLMLKSIWNYMDGMPRQQVDNTNQNIDINKAVDDNKITDIRSWLERFIDRSEQEKGTSK